MTTISDLIDVFARSEGKTWGDLQAALEKREDEIADGLRMAAAQLGGDPAFVSKVILDLGIGTRPDEATVALINQQFAERVDYWQQIARDNGQGEGQQ